MERGALILSVNAACALLLAGCSAKDPVTQTPVYHIGTPTNRASVNSWELTEEGVHAQPGRDHGKAVSLPTVPSQRGFEPDDPAARAVMDALSTDPRLSARYLTVTARHGVVRLVGSVTNLAQKTLAEQIARRVPGVKTLQSRIAVIPAR